MKVKVKSLSHVWFLVTPWTEAYQAPPSMGFSRQEYWSGLPLPSPHPDMTTGKTITLTYGPLSAKQCLLFYYFVITFLSRSKCLLTSWLQSLSTVISEPRKVKSVTVSTFPPSICHEMMGLGAMILVSWMLSLKPAFSLSSFILIKRLFGSSSLSAIRVVSFAYLRLLIFLPAILIPACDSFSLAFHMMYSAQKLNKQGDNIQPWCTPFPILNQFIISCPVLLLLDLHTGFLGDR